MVKTLFAVVVLILIGCASERAPSGDSQLAAASLTLFPAPPLSAQTAHDESLCAPVALYTDPLLAQVLMAAAHGSDIGAATRWIAQHPRAQLGHEITVGELRHQAWDPSVESLLAVPEVLLLMRTHRQWRHQLAEEFRAAPVALMDAVQRLRRRAMLAGSLQSNREQTVSTDGEVIAIEPAQPDVLYVPYYWPRVVFGPWPWPTAPPYSFRPPANVVFAGAPIGFGVPVNLTDLPWRWYHWDWRQHRLEPRAG